MEDKYDYGMLVISLSLIDEIDMKFILARHFKNVITENPTNSFINSIVVFECPNSQAEAIITLLLQKYDKFTFRFYRREKGKKTWERYYGLPWTHEKIVDEVKQENMKQITFGGYNENQQE